MVVPMPKVKIELYPPLTALLKSKEQRKGGVLTLYPEIGERDTLGDVVRRLVAAEKKLGKYLFDEKSGRFTDQVSIVLNGRFSDLIEGLNSVLKDGDSIILLQAWSGG